MSAKKLIEVALPLEAINKASAREKSIRHGHPSTLHLWWARRPLAAARAVIFAQMVDDPSSHPAIFPTEKAQDKERQRLFRIIEELVKWENTTNETVLQQAREEIWQSWRYTCAENADHPRAKELFDRNKLPAFHDPFAGGGALPLEAQRLGLESYASDLNPVAVLINKAMIEIPPKFAGRPPVNPESRKNPGFIEREWHGAQGLAEDVRYYGQWMRDEAEKRIGHLYPKIEVTAEMAKTRPDLKPYMGQKLTVIAWLWARTVKSPNPAFAHVDVPLASTFMLSTKPGKEAYVEPVIEGDSYRFIVKVGKPKNAETAKNGTKLSRGANFRCVMSDAVINDPYIKAESMAGRMNERLMAIVAEGDRGRVYLTPTAQHEDTAHQAMPEWKPDEPMDRETSNLVSGRGYGFFTWADLFTSRQLVALTTFSDLIQEARQLLRQDAEKAGVSENGKRSDGGVDGAAAYTDAIAMYLAFGIDKVSDYGSSLVVWSPTRDQAKSTFARQALPMVWDFSEINVFAGAAGDIAVSLDGIARVLAQLGLEMNGHAAQSDAQTQTGSSGKVVSTDPPYYDNIGYADLSDFFYVWLRRSMQPIFPELFATLTVPKMAELVATPYRHGGKENAEAYFLSGMTKAMRHLSQQTHPTFPVTIYYAFKQSETQGNGEGDTASTGWDTFLEAVIRAGFMIAGTWPIRTERGARSIGIGTNALASSIVLVCRPRAVSAITATRRDFVNALKNELPVALDHLQRGNIAPVDLAQAAIGPGMSVYTRYTQVLDANGEPLSVRDALALINQVLDETQSEQEGDFDTESRWALAWFSDHGFADGPFGDAHTYFLRFGTAENALKEAGLIAAGRNKVRLLQPAELPQNWDPTTDARLTVWEMVHHLIRVLEDGGENAAAKLVAKLGANAEVARELAYRLYTICERKKRAPEALSYNALVQSWPEITRLAHEDARVSTHQQTEFF